MPCGEKRKSHTETDAKNHCKPKTELATQAVLWQKYNGLPHIKKKIEEVFNTNTVP